VPSTVPGAQNSSHLPTASRGSFARKASDLMDSGVNSLSRKPQHKSFIGSSPTNKVLSSVDTSRLIDVFVSRLHPHSKVAEVEDCARRPTIIGDKLKIIDVHCEKLKSRYEHLYSSCHLQVRVKSADMKCAIDLSMSNTSWPQGLFVNRFFKRKEDGHVQQ